MVQVRQGVILQVCHCALMCCLCLRCDLWRPQASNWERRRLPLHIWAGVLEGLSWRDGCRAAAASRVFLEAGRSQRVLTFDGVNTEAKALLLPILVWLQEACNFVSF